MCLPECKKGERTMNINHTVTERFLTYVKIDTQSDPSSPSCPSTEKQKDLGRLLVKELKEIGIEDAEMDENGYVYGTIPSNSDKDVPVICFCSHMDTSPDCSGAGVNPVVHKNWDGSDIILPKDNSQVLRVSEHPALNGQFGNDIITADGTTLLGADNKAGVAEIMDAAYFLMNNPQVKHGTIKILFTPDEEIGRGVDKVNLEKVGAKYAYTMDGESLGYIEDETFSADGASIIINGVSTHPGFAKGKMENALKIAGEILAALPKEKSPEATEKKQGFIHPTQFSGTLEQATVNFIIRSFEEVGLKELEDELFELTKKVFINYPNSSFEFKIQEQYRNMKQVLDEHPQVVDYALEAISRSGLNPVRNSIRGGTDGSRLSFMGLPCPNIFAGEHAFHSKLEWVSVQDMQKAVETIIYLCMIWEEKS
jgi:tripeptide aminopeptidase